MSLPATETLYTPEDLLTMPDGDRYELVDGHLVERSMGSRSSYISSRLIILMGHFAWANRLGIVLDAEASYQCFPNRKVRKPDASFIRIGRLAEEVVPEGHLTIAPDLAIEVISPNDLHCETDRKVQEYLTAGTRLVWVVNPEVRTVLIYRANGSIVGVRESDILEGEDVIPGFRCPVAELFTTLAPN
jgi:Uma2 family endonuclease